MDTEIYNLTSSQILLYCGFICDVKELAPIIKKPITKDELKVISPCARKLSYFVLRPLQVRIILQGYYSYYTEPFPIDVYYDSSITQSWTTIRGILSHRSKKIILNFVSQCYILRNRFRYEDRLAVLLIAVYLKRKLDYYLDMIPMENHKFRAAFLAMNCVANDKLLKYHDYLIDNPSQEKNEEVYEILIKYFLS